MNASRPLWMAVFVAVTCVIPCAVRCWASEPFIERVAPLLERRCLGCHGADEPEGDFSLATAEGAFAGGQLSPGDSSASRLVELITPVDGEAEMPQEGAPLSPEEISAIRQWIEDGAPWPEGLELAAAGARDFDWWSYRPLKRPSAPDIDDDWVETPIDRFILRKQRQLGLSHSEKADRRTLIRRVTYDLTGLPPTPDEVEAFAADDDPRAYEKLVDRLLASPRYGERWARHWLDVVKYADTCGYDKDKLRQNAWPYRDYVIRSLNDDKPYGRFVQEQVAGDALFPDEPDGILGLGFIASGPWDFIGHVEVPESKIDGMVARNLDRDDMVSNTINTFCSVTVQCARCHDHKFDPVTQKDYYGLQAIFAAVDRADRPYDLDPQVEQRRKALQVRHNRLNADLSAVNREISEAGGPRLADLRLRIHVLRSRLEVKKDPEFGYHSEIAQQQDETKWVEVDLGRATRVARIILNPCHDAHADIGAGFGFPIRFRVEVMAAGGAWKQVRDQTASDYPNPGLRPVEINGINALVRRIRVTATKLMPRSGDFNFALAELQALNPNGANVAQGAAVASHDSIEHPVRWARQHLTDGRWPTGGDPNLQAELQASVREEGEILADVETPERLERRESLSKSIAATEKEIADLPVGKMVYAAATTFRKQGNFVPTNGKPRPIHVLRRGDVQEPGVSAIPGMLPLSMPSSSTWRLGEEANEAERRAALARWLTSPDNPLTWRSIVNRVWHYYFGSGIVSTPNDFGRMGATPTHPELLDWLSVEFRDGGQSLKALHRLIVTSGVYQQSSTDDASNAAIDSANQYLWRMNRRRLEAEEIRDSILAVSGALNTQMGGPGFYLFKLELTEHSPHYEYHKFDPTDEASHRRSIYRFIVRSQPDPWMTTLDCADSSQSTPSRSETLTSLQALSLLNNRFNLAMAQRFAARLQDEASQLRDQVAIALSLATQRKPNADELDDLAAYAEDHGLDNLCRLLFNLSEFVFLD